MFKKLRSEVGKEKVKEKAGSGTIDFRKGVITEELQIIEDE